MTTNQLPDYVSCVKGIYYIRYKGLRATIGRLQPGTAAFEAKYQQELALLQAQIAVKAAAQTVAPDTKKHRASGPATGTIDAVIEAFKARREFRTGKPNTTRNLETNFAKLANYTIAGERLGANQFVSLQKADLRAMLEDMSPGTIHPFLWAIRRLIKYAIYREDLYFEDGRLYTEDDNPTLRLQVPERPQIDETKAGFTPWKERHEEQYRARWTFAPWHREARLSMEIIRWTGCSATDVVDIGWHSVEPDEECGEIVVYDRDKTGIEGKSPLWPQLRQALEAAGIDRDWQGPWLRGADGEPTSAHNFSERFRGWCAAAGLPTGKKENGVIVARGCTAHGLRKRYATWLAEGGATTAWLRGAGAWKGDKHPSKYTESASKTLGARGLWRLMVGTEPPVPAPTKARLRVV